MDLLDLLLYFYGGVLLAHAVPHCVSGVMGQPFPTLWARLRGKRLSSPAINVLWGFCSAVAGYLLVANVGHFDLRSTRDVGALAMGALLASLHLARLSNQSSFAPEASSPSEMVNDQTDLYYS